MVVVIDLTGIIDVLPYNLTMNAPGANKPVKKSDLIAWLFVGAGIISASICAFIVFRRQHSLCKGNHPSGCINSVSLV